MILFAAPIFALLVCAAAWAISDFASAGLAALVLTFAAGWLAAASICGADFLSHLHDDGRCSASDWPSQVFGSFLAMAGILACAGFVSGRALRSFMR